MTQPLTRPARIFDDERGLHLYPATRYLLREMGPEYLDWDSIALRMEIEERWGSIGPLTWERVQAGRIMAGLDAFWTHMEIFENCSLALVGEIPVFSYFQPLEAESIAVALETAKMFQTHEYSDEVRGYIVACLLEDGIWFLDPPLDLVQGDLDVYDKDRSIQRPYDSVRYVLSRNPKMIPDPQGPAEVQANHVRSVQSTLTAYRSIIDKQLKELGLTGTGDLNG